MAEEKRDSNKRLREFMFKAIKASIKGLIFYVIYLVLSMFLAPVSEIVPDIQQIVEIFVVVYICLMIIGELTSGTIFQHFFNAAKALFTILYLALSLNGGIVGMTVQDVNLAVDLRLFLAVAMLLGLLGLAKSVLQAINFLNKKSEHVRF